MKENIAYALAEYEMYINGHTYEENEDYKDNAIDKMCDALEVDSIYCLISIDPFAEHSSYHFEDAKQNKDDLFKTINRIKIMTYTLPFTTRFFIIHEQKGLEINRYKGEIPNKKELWKEPDYNKLKRKLSIPMLYWISELYRSLPDKPLSRCGYQTYIKFITELKEDVEKTSKPFDIAEWMANRNYAIKQDTNTEYFVNDDILNGTGITIPNIPCKEDGLKFDAEAAGFMNLKAKGVIFRKPSITKFTAKLDDMKNATKKFSVEKLFENTQEKPKQESTNVQRKGGLRL